MGLAASLPFRPWNPRSWSTLPMLTVLFILHTLIFYAQLRLGFYQNLEDLSSMKNNNLHKSHHDHQLSNQLNDKQINETKPYWWCSSASLLLIILICCIKIKSLINERYEAHSIFDKGNVPSVPNKHPLSGNLFEMIVPDDNIHIHERYHNKLGKTYGMFYGPDPWILTVDPDLLQRVFTQEVTRTQFRLPFLTEFSRSLAQLQANQWRKQRKTLNPFFTCHQMKKDNVFDDVDKACAKVIESIRGHPDEKNFINSGAHIIDVNYQFKKFSLEVIFEVAYGYQNGIDMTPNTRNKLIDTIEEASYEVRSPIVWACISFDNLERFIGQLAKFTKIGTYIKYIHEIIDISLDLRREKSHLITQNERKMIDTIIECIDQNKMDYECVRSNLFFLLLAGFETTANTLTTLFWLLAKHSRVQEKLRDSILIEGDQAKYLEWTIMETLRLYPAVPSGIGRVLSEDIEHNGMKFFKGTTINASIYTLHREVHLWGQDSSCFNPDRFAHLKLHPAQYFAFGFGPRYCMGTNLAMAELRAITARILAKFRLEKCQSTPERINSISPNMIHMILEGQVNIRFVELSTL